MLEFQVNLTEAPSNRWALPGYPWRAAKKLLSLYEKDLGGTEQFSSLVDEYVATLVLEEHRLELEYLATRIREPIARVAVGNLYYDAIKFIFGCTAFACAAQDGPIHARNLDWWTENGMLAKHTQLVHFVNAPAGPFTAVSWPGFLGALSGMAPGRFSITLNSVLSSESPELARPITFWLRTVFEQAENYSQAIDMLTGPDIASDCLLLVTGTTNEEMCVIERSPTRSALRHAEGGVLVVANEYLALEGQATSTASELLATSSGRFSRASELVGSCRPSTAKDCLTILADSGVQLPITMQQMVFQPSSGKIQVELTA